MAKSAPSSDAIVSAVAEACKPHPIALAYLFGSHAIGKADAESDIDIAVLADEPLTKGQRFGLRLELMVKLAEALGVQIENMDVVVLQDVSILLKMNVIRSGIRAYERDRQTRMDFEYGVEQEYEDEEPMIEMETEMTIQRILSEHA